MSNIKKSLEKRAEITQRPVYLTKQLRVALLYLMIGTCLIYFFSNPESHSPYDYTLRIASQLIHGQLGQDQKPPSWLNEMIPFEGRYYSAFPLGSILTMLPAAFLKAMGIIKENPSALLVAIISGLTCIFLFLITLRYDISSQRRLMAVSMVLFGTWMWCNLAMAGAWQLALGFAVLGQLGTLYFILIKQRPFVAGCFFAVAFGNRTEIILVAPLFIYLLCRDSAGSLKDLHQQWLKIAKFCAVPVGLSLLTMAYNYARFHSAFDFGYARIPGVLNEPWYKNGIFSLSAIPSNAKEMLLTPWKYVRSFPYLVPTGFGGSILLSSPFLVLLFRKGAVDSRLKLTSWIAVAVLTFALWCHGNPGGWQFSYRYAMILLPWFFLILLENSPERITVNEKILFVLSLLINAYGTYLFLWTHYVKP